MISVIVPVYNAEKYLDQCIDSIKNQTYQDIEILIIDDGSTDGSATIYHKHKEDDSRIHIIKQDNLGVASARNTGLQKTHGEYIAFCDSDDVMHPNMLEILYKTIEQYDADVSACNFSRLMEDGNKIINDSADKIDVYDGKAALYSMLSDKRVESYFWNKLFKRELFNNIECPSGMNLCEDLFVLTKIFSNKQLRVAYNPKSLYEYRVMSNSLSSGHLNIFATDGTLKYVDAFETVMNIPELDSKAKLLLQNRCFEVAFSQLQLQINNDRATNEQIGYIRQTCARYYRYWVKTRNPIFYKIRKSLKFLYIYLKTLRRTECITLNLLK